MSFKLVKIGTHAITTMEGTQIACIAEFNRTVRDNEPASTLPAMFLYDEAGKLVDMSYNADRLEEIQDGIDQRKEQERESVANRLAAKG